MVSMASLWLPILLSAVAVFIASSLVHMVFRWHNADYRKLPNEDEVRAAVRRGSPAPGQYVMPHCLGPKEAAQPEMQQKFIDGPNAMLWVRGTGIPAMGPMLGLWFVLTLAVSYVVAYVAAHTLGAGAAPLDVLRVTASIAFLAYGVGSVMDGIWMGKPWGAVGKYLLDALIYGLAGGAVFAVLWPAAA